LVSLWRAFMPCLPRASLTLTGATRGLFPGKK